MDFRLTDDQQLLRRSVREFAETEIRPHVREWDEAQHFPSEVIPTLAALGLMGIQLPEQHGGSERPPSITASASKNPRASTPAWRCRSPPTMASLSAHIFLVRDRGSAQRSVPLKPGGRIGAWG